MKNINLLIVGLIAGVLISLVFIIAIQAFTGTQVYELKKDVQLDNGSTITKGTKMVKFRSMPEGYDTLRMCVNIPRGEIKEYFEIKNDKRPGLVISYWFK